MAKVLTIEHQLFLQQCRDYSTNDTILSSNSLKLHCEPILLPDKVKPICVQRQNRKKWNFVWNKWIAFLRFMRTLLVYPLYRNNFLQHFPRLSKYISCGDGCGESLNNRLSGQHPIFSFSGSGEPSAGASMTLALNIFSIVFYYSNSKKCFQS